MVSSLLYRGGGGGLYLGGAEARRSYVILNISSGLIFKPFIHFQVSPVSPAITSSTEDHDSSGLQAPTVSASTSTDEVSLYVVIETVWRGAGARGLV